MVTCVCVCILGRGGEGWAIICDPSNTPYTATIFFIALYGAVTPKRQTPKHQNKSIKCFFHFFFIKKEKKKRSSTDSVFTMVSYFDHDNESRGGRFTTAWYHLAIQIEKTIKQNT